MIGAMMLPLIGGSIRATAVRSFWWRRDRAIACFVVGYVAVWLAVGLAWLVPIELLGFGDWLHAPLVGAAAFTVAAAWQLTPAKRTALRACHWTAPLAPRGWAADRDCLQFGWSIGLRCVVTCWALMLACALAGHGLAPMAVASGVTIAERCTFRLDAVRTSVVLLVTALLIGRAALIPT
jgi:predicted metal-binding membrane protein